MPKKAVVRCDRAIAYLKATLLDSSPGPVIALDHEASPVFRPLGNGLLVSYVVDLGRAFQFITHGHAEAEGVSLDELHAIGLANLATTVNGLEARVHAAGPVFAVIAGGNFEASMLLLDDLWEEAFRAYVRGPYAVAIPARDILAFGDRSEPRAIAELFAIVERGRACDHRLIDTVLTRVDGAWHALVVPGQQP